MGRGAFDYLVYFFCFKEGSAVVSNCFNVAVGFFVEQFSVSEVLCFCQLSRFPC